MLRKCQTCSGWRPKLEDVSVSRHCSLEVRLETLMMHRNGIHVAEVPDLHWLERMVFFSSVLLSVHLLPLTVPDLDSWA